MLYPLMYELPNLRTCVCPGVVVLTTKAWRQLVLTALGLGIWGLQDGLDLAA